MLLSMYGSQTITDEIVATFMKEHRQAFYESHAQTLFRKLDAQHGHTTHVVKARQDTRFCSMLNEQYGGRSRSPPHFWPGPRALVASHAQTTCQLGFENL